MTIEEAIAVIQEMDWASYENCRTPEQNEAWELVKYYAIKGMLAEEHYCDA